MKPKATPSSAQPDFFQVELSSIISSRHPLVRLSREIPWDAFDHLLQPTYAPVMGAPGITTRLMVVLHYLKFLEAGDRHSGKAFLNHEGDYGGQTLYQALLSTRFPTISRRILGRRSR